MRNGGAQKLKRRRRNGENERWTLAGKAEFETKGFPGKCILKLTWETNLVSSTALWRRKCFTNSSLYILVCVEEKEDEEEEVA